MRSVFNSPTASSITPFAFIAAMLLGCSSGDQLRNDVSSVQIGASKATALLTLGQPAATNLLTVLWIEKQSLVYRSGGGTVCTVEILFDKVVARGCENVPH